MNDKVKTLLLNYNICNISIINVCVKITINGENHCIKIA